MSNLVIFSSIFSIIMFMVELALIVVAVIATWKTYKKAGEPGWAAIIPFYNSYVMFKISGKKNLFWGNLACAIGVIACYAVILIQVFSSDPYYYHATYSRGYSYSYSYGTPDMNLALVGICGILLFLFAIAELVIRIFMCIGLAKSFGKGGGFACGLIFLNLIFICILGFSKDIVYFGANGNPYGQMGGYNMYGQNPYGQPGNPNMYGQNPYGQPGNLNMYGQNPYGQPGNPNMYGQNPYGQPGNPNMYGQNPYGQPGNPNMYNQNPYGQPGNPNMYNQNLYGQPADQNMYNQNSSSQPQDNSDKQGQARPWNDIYNQ